MNIRKILLYCTSLLICILVLSGTALAHSGGTDSSGGHRDNKNKSGLGSYHYHHGMGPHLHPNGVCPYDTSAPVVVETPKDTISVDNLPSKMQLGDIVPLSWTVTYYTTYSISWSSSNSSVISVTDSGIMTAKSVGKAVITATMYNGSKSFTITVAPIQATDILLDAPDKLEVGDTYSTTVNILPVNTSDKTVTWKSSKKGVATVSDTGVITALSAGIAKITATTANGINNSFVVEVYEILPTSIKLSEESIELPLSTSVKLSAKIIPDNTTKPDIVWTSSDENIVTVSDGIIYGNSIGKAVISASCQNIVTNLSVNVYEAFPTDIKTDIASLHLSLGESQQIKASVIPSTASYMPLIWESSDEKIAVVDQNGAIKVVSQGNAVITVSCQNVSVDIPIEVYVKANQLIIMEDDLVSGNQLKIGSSIDLPVIFMPSNATYTDYDILSSNESVIQIVDNKLVAKGLGNAIITITSGELTDTLEFSVFSPFLVTIIPGIILLGVVAFIVVIIRRKKGKQNNY